MLRIKLRYYCLALLIVGIAYFPLQKDSQANFESDSGFVNQRAIDQVGSSVVTSPALYPVQREMEPQPKPTFHQASPLELPGPIAMVSDPFADFSAYTNWLSHEHSTNQFPGAAVAIVSSRGILDMQTWGVRSVDQSEPVQADTLFRIASVSKTFAGTVASQLVDQQLQNWDTPIIELLPQYSIGTDTTTRSMTLRHVLSHSTGLMPHAFSNMLDAGVSYEKIQEKFHEIPTVCSPGSCYGYQNVVFSLVADVVQATTSRSYEEYVQENIFAPLGMNTASLGLEAYKDNPNAGAPHQFARGGWRVSTTNPAYYTTGPASGVNATIMDMSRWAQANLGAFPDVLPKTLLDAQHSPVVETPRGNYFNRWPGLERAYYGLGWRVFDYAGVRVVHHGGGVRGFRTEMALIPEYDLAIVVLFNAETPIANEVIPHFLDTVLAREL